MEQDLWCLAWGFTGFGSGNLWRFAGSGLAQSFGLDLACKSDELSAAS